MHNNNERLKYQPCLFLAQPVYYPLKGADSENIHINYGSSDTAGWLCYDIYRYRER